MFRRFSTIVGLALVAIPAVAPMRAHSHPTVRELREELAERARCEPPADEEKRIDPIRLGMSERELLRIFPDLRRDGARGDMLRERLAEPSPEGSHPDPGQPAGPRRWIREGAGDLVRVDYETWRGRVYRIRWRLPTDFERPVIDEFGRRARICFGPPEYDQTFEAEPGSSRATLRRMLWRHADRQIELRQLHPLRGGPVYLSVTATDPLREIGAAGWATPAEPDRSEPWWRRSTKTLVPATRAERDRLGRDFMRFLAGLDH